MYAFSTLQSWGWITIIIGVIQLAAGLSLIGGGGFGRVIGIIAASIGALESLLSVGSGHPFWALGIFAICLWVLHGLVIYAQKKRPAHSWFAINGPSPTAIAMTSQAVVPQDTPLHSRCVVPG